VRKIDATNGIVEVPELTNGQSGSAMIRVGSQLSDEVSLFSINLESGDRVEILGEKTMPTERGPVRMYQIKPPAQEFRWVKGDYIVPATAAQRQQNDRDPFSVPVAQKTPDRATQAPLAQTATVDPAHQQPQAIAEPVAPLSGDVEVLDQQLTEMLSQDPATWRLDEFEAQFQQLLPMSDPVNASLIRQRLASIAARKQAHADYLDFVRLTSETTQREQQLLAMQQGGFPAQPAAYPQVRLGAPQPIPGGAPTPASMRSTDGTPRIEPIPDPSQGGPAAGPVMPRFDGAGIVQRSGNPLGTVPPYVLLSPNGKLLAFLEPGPGANLDPYVGQSMGIIGQRGFDARLQADRIVVRRAQPVQLAP